MIFLHKNTYTKLHGLGNIFCQREQESLQYYFPDVNNYKISEKITIAKTTGPYPRKEI